MFGGDKSRDFQRGMNTTDSRRRRETERLRLRKKDREERLQKRRQVMRRGGEPQQSGFPHQTGFPNMPGHMSAQQFDEMAAAMLAQLPMLVRNCFQDNPEMQFDATQRIRKLLSIERSPPIQQVIESGVVPRLVQFLRSADQEKLQFEAAWALTNIASGNAEHTAVVIRHGAIPLFVELLSAKSAELVEQATWALGNIAGDSPECRDMVLQHGALQRLLPLCRPVPAGNSQALSLLRNATWTLSNFCRGKPQPAWELIKDGLPFLQNLLSVDDEEVLQDSSWAFSYLSDIDSVEDDVRVRAIVNSGTLRTLIHLLGHEKSQVKHPCLRTIGNIVTGDDMQTQQVINMGALPKLLGLLECDKKGIKKEACWTISNITAGNVEQIEAVIGANLIHPLVHLLNEDEFDVQKEAAWALSNATSGGNPAQIRFLVNQGCIPPLAKLLECENHKIVMVALEGLENMLKVGEDDRHLNDGVNRFATFVEECGGLEKLEQLQAREEIPNDLFEKAAQVVRTYFDGMEDDGELPDGAGGGGAGGYGAAPAHDGSQFGFGGGPPQGGFGGGGGASGATGGGDNPPDRPFVF